MSEEQNVIQQVIDDGNRLIAGFIGWYEDPAQQQGTWYKRDTNAIIIAYSVYNNYPHRDLPFHRSWNDLMPAVIAVKALQNPSLSSNGRALQSNLTVELMGIAIGERAWRQDVWQAVVNIIKLHNDEKTKSNILP